MRTIIAGSREVIDYDLVKLAVAESGFEVTVVLSGTARGVDRLGERYALENDIPVEKYPPDWNNPKLKKSAGYVRNVQMADNADALIALWDCKSPGTKHMIDIAIARKLKVFIFYTNKDT